MAATRTEVAVLTFDGRIEDVFDADTVLNGTLSGEEYVKIRASVKEGAEVVYRTVTVTVHYSDWSVKR